VAEDRKRERLVVLPCVESLKDAGTYAAPYADRFAGLRADLVLLPVTLPSTLAFRVQSEHPDAIVIAAGNTFLARARNGRELREIFSDTPALLLAEEVSAAVVRSAGRLRIYSVLPAEMSPAQLVAAIAATAAGFAVTLPQPASGPTEVTAVSEDLTAREVEVLRLMARGQRNKQLAVALNISQHTAKYHVSAVMAKLGARTRTEAVTIGVMRGLVAI
jgi:DNA-binding NarL/FixJ family response regulator